MTTWSVLGGDVRERLALRELIAKWRHDAEVSMLYAVPLLWCANELEAALAVPQSNTTLEIARAYEAGYRKGRDELDHGIDTGDLKRNFAAYLAAQPVEEAVPQPVIAREEAAFKAGYHCQWTGHEYVFDPVLRPGDPDGAWATYLAACLSPPTAEGR